MFRKGTTLAAAVAAVVVAAAGLSFADEDSPMHQLMEKVTKDNNAIGKAVRSAVSYKKSQKDLPALAESLVKLGKEARDLPDAKKEVEKAKKSMGEWTGLMDDFIKKTEDFKSLVSKPGTTQSQAKSSHTQVKTACANCHTVFRLEDIEQ